MSVSRWSILPLLFALAACGSGGDRAPDASTSAQAVNSQSAGEPSPVAGPQRHILAFGDSLFAGKGVGLQRSYPAQMQAALRAKGINAVIANAGVSGDTTAAGLERLAFTLDAQPQKPDLVLLELGANDMLRGISPEQTRANLGAMLDVLKKRGIAVLIMGMRAPPNYGAEYEKSFDAIYPDLAKRYKAKLVPFWLESIYQRPELFQSDHLHPTVEGIGILVKATEQAVEQALPPPPDK